jgi:RNA polymerase sigma-B factor
VSVHPPATHDVEATVLAHRPLARRLARRYARGDRDVLEELEQVAALGLVQAARRFDPSRGTTFSAFAVPTILGELRRHFRATRWAAHVPRRLQESFLEVRAMEERLMAQDGRAPSAAQLAERLGWTVEDVLEVRSAASALAPVSLDRTITEDADAGSPLMERLGAEDPGYRAAELRDELEQAMAALDAPANEALRLRVEQDLSVGEVAARIGVSPSHASKILDRALRKLRTILAPADHGRGSAVVPHILSAPPASVTTLRRA